MANVEENDTIKKNFDNVKDDFKKIIKDFIKDLLITFPELDDRLDKTLVNDDASEEALFKYYKDDLPDPEKFQEHLSGLLDGKIGNLAKEIAEETANDLDVDVNNAKSTGEVFEKLVKDPTKLMGLVKNIGGKIQYKIKSGEVKESELLEEAKEIVEKLKTTPGLKNMMSKMGMGSGANRFFVCFCLKINIF